MNIYDLSYSELQIQIANWEFDTYRATQIWQWLYLHKVNNFVQMKNIPKKLIKLLNNNYTFHSLTEVIVNKSEDGTVKILFSLNDNQLIETVLIKHNYGNSICITTQVGCNIGCSFCASGQLTKLRDLTAGEMIAQIIETEKIVGEKINTIVIMGIGEPFDNYKNLLKFLSVVNNPEGLAIGARNITVSTSGIVPKIKDFADLEGQYNLAISLHAPDDLTRSKLMKINDRFGVNEVIDAIKYYQEKNNRRVTIEYILINEVNDTPEHAKRLISLLEGLHVYINLIPYNPVVGNDYMRSTDRRINDFYNIINKSKIKTVLRKEQGADIDAACGQLRSVQMKTRRRI